MIRHWFGNLSLERQALIAMTITTVFFIAWVLGIYFLPWVMIPLTILAVGFTVSGGAAVVAYVSYYWFIDFFQDTRQQAFAKSLREMTQNISE